MEFEGAKIALYFGEKLIVYLRDDKPGLVFANMWDFAGGGREGNETGFECAGRELQEEFGITLRPEAILYEKIFPAMINKEKHSYFFVAEVTQGEVDNISFGEEGQRWVFMTPEEFLNHEDAIPDLKDRLQDYLDNKSK